MVLFIFFGGGGGGGDRVPASFPSCEAILVFDYYRTYRTQDSVSREAHTYPSGIPFHQYTPFEIDNNEVVLRYPSENAMGMICRDLMNAPERPFAGHPQLRLQHSNAWAMETKCPDPYPAFPENTRHPVCSRYIPF
ncbi:hypothetical protein TNCT_513261 [Trichonephila clavata]|uniref:Uncharacterized protein n=1 Tax=Trichonephila clavata TaxID=2740835 RepID=A0A8X6LMU6_TRICU|nr:hypothetical protein TNCT_513261 [Trichonephila clavata]